MTYDIALLLDRLGVDLSATGSIIVRSPIDGATLAEISERPASQSDKIAGLSTKAFEEWRAVPAPQRGELIRYLGEELRRSKEDLAKLVTIECGKILSEGLGEVQEMIDICDFAVGLSRQLYGLTIASERPEHHMREMWHPLGPVLVISAFNFPVAVWSWNAALAIVCGDPVVWKPSEKTPLTAMACEVIFERAVNRYREAGHKAPDDLLQVVIGGKDVGAALVDNAAFPLVSATGSTAMGRAVAERTAARLGRSLLELGGNNAMIVTPSANLDLAVRAVLFGAVGTCGQRCTSLRRLIIHDSIRDEFTQRLINAYKQIRIGSPLDTGTLIGPLIDEDAWTAMDNAIQQAGREKGSVLTGGQRADISDGAIEGGAYVKPTIIAMPEQSEIVRRETFAPILYTLGFKEFEEAIALQNDVPQGLSSCIFTSHVQEAERFLSAAGSDCGIANVNIGPSGAEIGGAFGGEKETGGGRESGSDSWKSYMRRQTQTVNYSSALPLAQGVKFDL